MLSGKTWILDLSDLVPAFIDHPLCSNDKSILLGKVVHLGSRVGVSDGNLNRLHVQLFGKIDGTADRLAALARQAKDEVAMHEEAQLLRVFGELARAFHGGALLNVL